MCRSGTTYCPDSFVVMVCTRPVSVFVIVIFTFAITDPEGSVTVPTRVASCANACKERPKNSATRATRCRFPNHFAREGIPRKHKELSRDMHYLRTPTKIVCTDRWR